eukprot:752211-Hanusia_phi.AAC.5
MKGWPTRMNGPPPTLLGHSTPYSYLQSTGSYRFPRWGWPAASRALVTGAVRGPWQEEREGGEERRGWRKTGTLPRARPSMEMRWRRNDGWRFDEGAMAW